MKRMYRVFLSAIAITAALLSAGCSGKLSERARLHNRISIDGIDVSEKTVGEARALIDAAAQTRLAALTVKLELPGKTVSVPAASLGIGLDTESALKQAAALKRKGGNRLIVSSFVVDQTRLQSAASEFAKNHSSAPVDASCTMDKELAVPVTYQHEQPGVQIDAEALGRAVRSAVEAGSFSTVAVPYLSCAPEITLEQIQRERALVAQFTTTFESASQRAENRVFNIVKAAECINGTVLQPGEEFDCNAALGDRTEENGWRLAPGIRSGRYEDEYGGGVCQVSSTLFNAVMMADLLITEREPHSWPMGYVEIGRDATISTGGKNFRFVNSTDAPVYLYLFVDEEALSVTASIYGRPLPDGQYIVVTSEATGTIESAGEEIMLDETLPYNTRVQDREARDGKTAVTYKEYYSRSGELLDRTVAYRDTYRAINGLVYVSTDLYYSP